MVAMGGAGQGGHTGGRIETIEVTSRFHLPPVPPHLASRQLGASACTKGKFSVSGWLKTLTLEETIEGNINTVGHATVHSASPAPFPLTKFLFLSVLFSLWFHSSPTSLIFQTLQTRPFFPYLAKGRMTRIKLVLAQPRGFVLSELWQVTVAMMRWIINHQPILSGDVTQAPGTPEVSGRQYWWFVANLSASDSCPGCQCLMACKYLSSQNLLYCFVLCRNSGRFLAPLFSDSLMYLSIISRWRRSKIQIPCYCIQVDSSGI